jgi:ATP/maltotriose-dependent transcriptional regulator MalT
MRGLAFLGILFLTISGLSQDFRSQIKVLIQDKDDKIGELHLQLSQYPDPYERAVICNLIGLQYQFSSELDSAMNYHSKALSLANDADAMEEAGISLNKIGIVHYYWGNIDTAEIHFQHALEKLETKSLIANCQNNLGLMQKLQGKLDQSIQNYLLSLATYKELEEDAKQITILNNIGSLYREMDQPNDALAYFDKGEKQALAANDVVGEMMSKMNKGAVYITLEQPQKGLELYSEVHNYYLEQENFTELIAVKNNLANCLNKLGKNDSAKTLYKETYELMHKLGVLNNQDAVLANLASLHEEEGDFEEALKLYHSALHVSYTGNLIQNRELLYNGLSSVYAALGMADSALYYKDMLIALKDSLDKVEKENKANELGEMYKNAELTSSLEEKEKEFDQVNQKAGSLTKVLWWSLFGITSLIVLVIILFRRSKKRAGEIGEREKSVKDLRTALQEKEKTIEQLAVIKGVKLKPYPENLDPLTEREKEVLCCVKEGLKDKEISESLFISIATVRTHIRKAYVKIDVRNRAEAIKFISEYEI